MALSDPWVPTDGLGSAPLGRAATPIRVRRYDPDGGYGATLTSVVPVEIRDGLGPDPGTARLRYRYPGTAPPFDAFEAVNTSTPGSQVVRTGDRLVIEAMDPAEAWHPIFDGFAYGFELHADADHEAAQVTCVGVASRCYSQPVGGAIYRPGPDYDDSKAYVVTDVIAHFNPKGEGNRLPDWFNRLGNTNKNCSLFVDPGAHMVAPDDAPAGVAGTTVTPSSWGLHDAAAYILYTSNEQTYVANPDRQDIDDCLQAHVPKPESTSAFNPLDPTTYNTTPIPVPDKPVTGKSWPTVLHEIVADKGFTYRWSLAADESGNPATAIEFLRADQLVSKSVYLQPRGSDIDPLLSNMARASLVRDVSDAINIWTVEGDLTEHEASFVLGAGFYCNASDAQTDNLHDFDRGVAAAGARAESAYRLFIFDEAGEGHWVPGDGEDDRKTDIPSLNAVFGDPTTDGKGNYYPRYANRRRRPFAELVSEDADGKPLKARLEYSVDYRADEMQGITFSGSPSGGSFALALTLGEDTFTTSSIAYDSSAAQVQTALESLDGVEPGDVAVSGSAAAGFKVSFRNNLGAQPIAQMAVQSNLTGGAASTTQLVAGAPGSVPALWDGSGTWNEVTTATWKLLKDRIGIEVTAQNPNNWHTGSRTEDVLPLVESLAAPTKGHPKVSLMLTCVVKSDQRLKGVADYSANNARTDTLSRVVDAHDRYKKKVLCKNSKFNHLSEDIVTRDDSESAVAEAQAMQFVTQNGVLDGLMQIPYFTAYYRPGDRISDINGRSLSLRTDGGLSGSVPVYPIVVRRTWRLDGEQRTVLELSDASTARAGYMRRGRGSYTNPRYP